MWTNTHFILLLVCLVVFIKNTYPQCKQETRTSKANIIHGRYTRDITDFQIVVPQKVHANGSFHSHHLPHFFNPSVRKKRNLADERVHYILHFNNTAHLLELEPNAHLTSPGMVVESRTEGGDLGGVSLRRPRKHLCHFRGSVRGQPSSRVALSGCDGLVGYVRTKHGLFFVEPLHGESPEAGKEHVHVVYKRSLDMDKPGRSCNVRDDWWSTWCSRMQSMLETKTPHKRSEAGVSVQRWYETMIAADKKFLTFHKDHDVEEYIICIMNMVSDFYHDASVGNLVDIVIVRIIYLEKEEKEIDLEINTDGEDTLDSFCKWQLNLNPKDHNHPNHHDIAVLFTRYDICADNEDTCSLLGLAHLGTSCTDDKNCCINEDAGLILGLTTAHELGHTLSCTHDAPEESGCEPRMPTGDSTVMNPTVKPETGGWSPCSRAFITGLFDSQLGECMLDEPKDHKFPLDDMPAGAFYDADEQCVFRFGSKYIHYDYGGDKFCQKLWCKERDSPSTLSDGAPPAEGTKCGDNKWCYNKLCVEMGERPTAVNGEWGGWGQWSECSRTCGGGVSLRERLCNNPQPLHKGRYCIGKRHEYNICNTKPCDSSALSFRQTQCAEFNSQPFMGKMHTWKTYKNPDSDPNPCALYCINDVNTFSKLAPRVKDGTRCKHGTKNTCVQGSCMPVGCDWKIASPAVEDVCGICDGDGTHCTLFDGVFDGPPKAGYNPIVMVPAGAVNVKLEELSSSTNMIAASAVDNKTFYLNGYNTQQTPGEYDFDGVKGMYIVPEKSQEELHIRGPLKEPVVLYYSFYSAESPGVRYSYAIPSDKPMYTPKYHWEIVDWGPCSAQCGGGTQVMKESCIEERDGKVRDSFCAGLTREEPRARTCNDQPCSTRWKVWKWGPCSGCVFQSGVRTRQVECVKQNPTITGDEEIIAEPSECCGEPPSKTELCNSPKPCPKNMTSAIVKKRNIEVMTIQQHVAKKRANDGNSFSDGSGSTSPAAFVKDPVHPETVHLEEVLLGDSQFSLSEQEYEELGDEVPDKVLACPVQSLSGKAAIHRIEELAHGVGYHKNITKINTGHHKEHSRGATTEKKSSDRKQSLAEKSKQ